MPSALLASIKVTVSTINTDTTQNTNWWERTTRNVSSPTPPVINKLYSEIPWWKRTQVYDRVEEETTVTQSTTTTQKTEQLNATWIVYNVNGCVNQLQQHTSLYLVLSFTILIS